MGATKPYYGTAHQAMRRDLARYVARGEVRCARCRKMIEPGEPWDLGHVDGDPNRYAGAEHRRCNRATAPGGVRHRRVSRDW